jgi:hypothetical protein
MFLYIASLIFIRPVCHMRSLEHVLKTTSISASSMNQVQAVATTGPGWTFREDPSRLMANITLARLLDIRIIFILWTVNVEKAKHTTK